MKYDIIIIGGGASGLMLAAQLDLTAYDQRINGLIMEKTSRPGTKLLMSGGGRCNITHGGAMKDFVKAYGASGKKLRRVLYRYSNAGLASWLEENGIDLADENGVPVMSGSLYDPADDTGRIFPASMKSSDILELLLEKAASNGWNISKECEVSGISGPECIQGKPYGWKVMTKDGNEYSASSVVIATGGITYPATGSDGSMLGIVSRLGVDVVPPRSALAQVYVEGYPYESLSGISIPDVTVSIYPSGAIQGKPSASITGDVLFTHKGLSGPAILNISRFARPGNMICLSYNKELEELPRRMQRILESRSAGPSGDIRTTILASLLENDAFSVSSVDSNGMVTAGGISLDEIDTSTMKIRRLSSSDGSGGKDKSPLEAGSEYSVYAIGEAIDADGCTGGYNLQMCWSTASAAADSLRNSLEIKIRE